MRLKACSHHDLHVMYESAPLGMEDAFVVSSKEAADAARIIGERARGWRRLRVGYYKLERVRDNELDEAASCEFTPSVSPCAPES